MTTARVNLVAGLVSLAASIVWIFLGQALSGLIWFAASLAWSAIGVLELRRAEPDPHPVRTLARKFSRLLMWS